MISNSVRCVVTVVSIVFVFNIIANFSIIAISVVPVDVVIISVAIIRLFTSAVNVAFAFAAIERR